MQATQTNKNTQLHELLLEATGTETKWTSDVRANLFGWLHLDAPGKLKNAAEALAGKVRLCTVTAYSEERNDEEKRRRIAYHFAGGDTLLTVTIPVYDKDTLEKLPVPSITPWFLNADWNEREFIEMFNIQVEGHPNPKRLFLDERLDAGIMTELIPFSAMANSAATNTLWERILEAKGVPEEDRMPSLTVPAEPIKLAPKVTPVSETAPSEKEAAVKEAPTLVNVAALAEAVKGVLEENKVDQAAVKAVLEKIETQAQAEPAVSATSEGPVDTAGTRMPDTAEQTAPATQVEESATAQASDAPVPTTPVSIPVATEQTAGLEPEHADEAVQAGQTTEAESTIIATEDAEKPQTTAKTAKPDVAEPDMEASQPAKADNGIAEQIEAGSGEGAAPAPQKTPEPQPTAARQPKTATKKQSSATPAKATKPSGKAKKKSSGKK